MKAWSGPLGFVGGTVLPFLIHENSEKCRENRFMCLLSPLKSRHCNSRAQEQLYFASENLTKDFTKLMG